jgi:saccharopine dehydrogenase-like NADP-dependent oxidoreductase
MPLIEGGKAQIRPREYATALFNAMISLLADYSEHEGMPESRSKRKRPKKQKEALVSCDYCSAREEVVDMSIQVKDILMPRMA